MNQLAPLRGLTIIVFSLWMFVSVHTSLCGKIGVTTFSTEGSSNGVCPSESVRDYLRSTLQQEVRNQLRTQATGNYTCDGTPGWTQIVHMNMANASQTCPSGWVPATFNGLRVCGRPPDAGWRTCTQATFPTGSVEYRQVCGRALGYQYGDQTAFGAYTAFTPNSTINDYYLDGLTLTHGQNGSRQHIWSFVNGYSENRHTRDACPCAPFASNFNIPSFIGSNYFCESGSVDSSNIRRFHNEPLWDGTGCSVAENTCCNFNSPPYFSIQLLSATTNNIDGRLCGYENLNIAADTFITFLELYIK